MEIQIHTLGGLELTNTMIAHHLDSTQAAHLVVALETALLFPHIADRNSISF